MATGTAKRVRYGVANSRGEHGDIFKTRDEAEKNVVEMYAIQEHLVETGWMIPSDRLRYWVIEVHGRVW